MLSFFLLFCLHNKQDELVPAPIVINNSTQQKLRWECSAGGGGDGDAPCSPLTAYRASTRHSFSAGTGTSAATSIKDLTYNGSNSSSNLPMYTSPALTMLLKKTRPEKTTTTATAMSQLETSKGTSNKPISNRTKKARDAPPRCVVRRSFIERSSNQ